MKRRFSSLTFVLTSIFLTKSAFCASSMRRCPSQGIYPKSYEQGYEVSTYQMASAYNTSDSITLNRPWNFFVNGSFIWWNASEEGLELALSDPSGPGLPTNLGQVINLDFKYKPGFKVGLGVRTGHDNWEPEAQYTWLHFSNTIASSAPNPTPPGALYPLQTHPENVQSNSSIILIDEAQEQWKVDLDLLDLVLTRSYCVGVNLAFKFSAGARVQWIKQQLNSSYRNASTTNTFHTKKKSSSWGLGPRVGLDTDWAIMGGLRLIGNVATNLIYTKYHINQEEQNATNPSQLAISFSDKINVLRPISEFQMGIGYATYSFYKGFHFDIFATYDFHIFWNQNVFRLFVDDLSEGISFIKNGDLFLHGLTVNLKIDF